MLSGTQGFLSNIRSRKNQRHRARQQRHVVVSPSLGLSQGPEEGRSIS